MPNMYAYSVHHFTVKWNIIIIITVTTTVAAITITSDHLRWLIFLFCRRSSVNLTKRNSLSASVSSSSNKATKISLFSPLLHTSRFACVYAHVLFEVFIWKHLIRQISTFVRVRACAHQWTFIFQSCCIHLLVLFLLITSIPPMMIVAVRAIAPATERSKLAHIKRKPDQIYRTVYKYIREKWWMKKSNDHNKRELGGAIDGYFSMLLIWWCTNCR